MTRSHDRSGRARERRQQRRSGRPLWPRDWVEADTSVERPLAEHGTFGPVQLAVLTIVMVALVVVIVASKGEDHSRYGAGPDTAHLTQDSASTTAP